MDAAPVLLASDPLAVLRVFNRLRRAGVRLSVDGGRLAVESGSPLSDTQRAFLHAHKHELVGLLEDAATLAAVLADAGADGIAEETLAEWGWPWERQFSASDVLIGQSLAWFASGYYFAAGYGPRPAPNPPPLPRPPTQTPKPLQLPQSGIRITSLSIVEAVLGARNRDEYQEAIRRI